ncbi:MAG: glycosyltransferase family 4 protein [Gemmataceae bacterium]
MRIAYVTAGAAGMLCGSCMRDNTLVAALAKLGHEAHLIPTYTPIRTDEEDVSERRVFFGGINVYLQQNFALFRHTPWLFDRLLDVRGLLRWVSRFAVKTRAEDLGDLTVSMLEGEHGYQRKEVEKLVTWLADELRPEVVNLTAALLSGMVHELKRRLPGVPVLCSLQGDDIFTESLPPAARARALALIRDHGREIDGFVATSAYYADAMAPYFGLPREKIHVVYPGLNLAGHGGRPDRSAEPFTIGYFARICPEKGFHRLIDAYLAFRKLPGTEGVKLRVSGWLGGNQRAFYEAQVKRLADAGLIEDFEHLECPDHVSKVNFLHGIDVLSVPTTYREPKGLYVLEAWANGVPVVQPRHGSFPELVEQTGGGLLVEPGDAEGLARAWLELKSVRRRAAELGACGRAAVWERFTAARMAEDTLRVYQECLRRAPMAPSAPAAAPSP